MERKEEEVVFRGGEVVGKLSLTGRNCLYQQEKGHSQSKAVENLVCMRFVCLLEPTNAMHWLLGTRPIP